MQWKVICATPMAAERIRAAQELVHKTNNGIIVSSTTMFTGIIEEVGRITGIRQAGENRRITIDAPQSARELKTGDSVAVSGVCLTALAIKSGSFSADLAPETWART